MHAVLLSLSSIPSLSSSQELRSACFFVKGQQNQKDNLAAGYHNDKRDKETRLQKVSYDASEAISLKRDEHLQKE